MTSEPQAVSGSLLWQVVFLSFAVVLILFEVVRGWRLGLLRQLIRLVALVAAYAAAFFGGSLLHLKEVRRSVDRLWEEQRSRLSPMAR